MDSMDKINQGLELHKKGDYQAAERLYLAVLAQDPANPDAHNLLASLYHSLGDDLRALPYASTAVSRVRSPHALNNRATVYIGMGWLQEAVKDLRDALRLDPLMAEAHSNLCVAYRLLKDYKKAIEHGKRAVALRPELVDGWVNLGVAQQDTGQLEDALVSYRKAQALGNGMASANIGKLQYQLQNFPTAIEAFQAAYAQGLDGLDIRFGYAHSLLLTGQLETAANMLEEGFNQAADFSQLPALLGQDPFFDLVYRVNSYFARMLGQPQRAIAIFNRCLEKMPDCGPMWLNLGTLYFENRLLPDAMRCFEKAVEVAPGLAMGYNNLGVCYTDRNELVKAIGYFEKALSIQPELPCALGWLLGAKSNICDWDGYDEVKQRVSNLRNTGSTDSISPFIVLSVFTDPDELHYWARLAANELFSATEKYGRISHAQHPRRKKIRLGYYSFDFRDHPVAHLTARMFELHDKSRFEIYIYSYGPDDNSEARRRVQAASTHFVDVKDLSVVDTAKRIAQDDLDILVDLTGNTRHTRSHIMAMHPARIQMHWLGFIGTMGSSHYDYIIADEWVAPPGDEQYFSEKILRLPTGMHIMDDDRVISASHQTRTANGLPEQGVVFGCFCQSFKIQPEIFASWMEILRGVSGSVLWLASGPDGMEQNLHEQARRHGVDPARLVIAQRCSRQEYLARLALMDLYLDTYPYTSGTVASDALFAGCPLLTLTGETMVSRMAGSIVRQAGLPELACDSPAAYVAQAVRLGNSPKQLATLRKKLAKGRSAAPLFNTSAAVKALEKLFADVVESSRGARRSHVHPAPLPVGER